MGKSASVFAVAALATLLASGLAQAADLQCAEKPVVGQQPGFYPSPGAAQDVAKKAWLDAATAVFKDATWETAKDPHMVCAIQGLFHNCTATAVPCGNEPGQAATAPAAPAGAAPPANQ